MQLIMAMALQADQGTIKSHKVKGETSMKRHVKALLLTLITLFVLSVATGYEHYKIYTTGESPIVNAELTSNEVSEIRQESFYTADILLTYEESTQRHLETTDTTYSSFNKDESAPCYGNEHLYTHYGGGDFRECNLHSAHFHALDAFILSMVSVEDFVEWSAPLRAEMRNSQAGCCLINLSTFIDHFELSRDDLQRVINENPRVIFSFHYNLDILFSGDTALIEQYYCISNERTHSTMAREREVDYLSRKIMGLQQTVNVNVRMSRHYHDIWTYARFMTPGGMSMFSRWMQDLVDSGQYDRVNIVELVNYFRIPRHAFEGFVNEFNMYLFTHYNTDAIFSGNRQLIEAYYALENEAQHSSQVQAVFEQHVALHGAVDTEWMLDWDDN